MKLTRWFPDDIKPVRPGVYERQVTPYGDMFVCRYAMWTGDHWKCLCATAREAKTEWMASANGGRWRGLKKEQK